MGTNRTRSSGRTEVPATDDSTVSDAIQSPSPWWQKGTFSAIALTLVVLGSSLVSDKWIPNSQLTLPLLASTIITSLVAAIGIPRLKALRMGQIIRTEGPSGHQSKAGTPTMGGLLVVS